MRSHLSKLIKSNNYFLHADMWNIKRFPLNSKVNVINVGLGESNLLNIAGGIASQGNTVFVYGVAGFIMHRLEQLKFSCRDFGADAGKIIICNAGKIGYAKLGAGHTINDDKPICDMLNIPFYSPENIEEFKKTLMDIELEIRGIFYIQLGKDYD